MSTLEDYAKEVYSGGAKGPTIHADSDAIRNPRAPMSTAKKLTAALVTLVVFVIFGSVAIGYYLFTLPSGPPMRLSPVVSRAENMLGNLSKVEVVRSQVDDAWSDFPDQYRESDNVLAKINADKEVALAQVRSQEKIVLETIREYYESPNMGILCVTWQGTDKCYQKARSLQNRLR